MQPTLKIAVDTIRAASRVLVRSLEQLEHADVDYDQRTDFVNEVRDRITRECINGIAKFYPSHSILSETGEMVEGDKDNVWLITPLDGNRNYSKAFPHFCMALAFQHKKQTQHAVIFDPIRDELFTASKGDGAKLNNRRIRVSQLKKIEQALIGTSFPYKQLQHLTSYLDIFKTLFPLTAGMRRAGCACLDLVYTACGRLDGLWAISMSRWEMTAGLLILREAGGFATDFHEEDNYYDTGNLLAGNAKIIKSLSQTIQTSLDV